MEKIRATPEVKQKIRKVYITRATPSRQRVERTTVPLGFSREGKLDAEVMHSCQRGQYGCPQGQAPAKKLKSS